jgi:hypothetical protein
VPDLAIMGMVVRGKNGFGASVLGGKLLVIRMELLD